jgi:hypothetical protein
MVCPHVDFCTICLWMTPFLLSAEAFCHSRRMTVFMCIIGMGAGLRLRSGGTSPRYKSSSEFSALFTALFCHPLLMFLSHTTLFFPFVTHFTDQLTRTTTNSIHEIARSFD